MIRRIKNWLFLRKLNKAIKGYGAKASIINQSDDGLDKLHIKMRKFYCEYPMSNFENKNTQEIIDIVIKELKMQNILEAYE